MEEEGNQMKIIMLPFGAWGDFQKAP